MGHTRSNRYEPESRLEFARVYWTVLVALFAVAGVASIIYGVWQFTRPFNQAASEAIVGAPKASLNRADIQEVLDGFDVRARQFEERRTVPLVRDPS